MWTLKYYGRVDLVSYNTQRLVALDLFRIIAIILVVVFHLGYFPYGYVGVDMFFVISGAAIYSFAHLGEHKNNFKPLLFLKGRLERLILPLVVVVIVTLIVFYPLLLDVSRVKLIHTAATSLLFVSNAYLFTTADYFAQFQIPNPLIHLWSLSTEIWFYIIFSACFIFIKKTSNLVCLIIAVSLFNLGYLSFAFETIIQADFYLLGVNRLNEFCLGALFMKLTIEKKDMKKYLWLLGFVPLFLMVFDGNYLALSQIISFGLFALLIISSKKIQNFAAANPQFLKYNLADYVYVLFLVHWPVIVYFSMTTDSIFEMLFLSITTSILLTIMMKIFIDRRSLRQKIGRPLLGFLCLFAIFTSIWVYTGNSKYLVSNSAIAQTASDEIFAGDLCETDLNRCNTLNKQPMAILLGDSNARQLRDVVVNKGFNIKHLSSHCIFREFCHPVKTTDHDKAVTLLFNDQIQKASDTPVFVGYQWNKFFDGYKKPDGNSVKVRDQKQFAKAVVKELRHLQSVRTAKIFVYGQIPTFDYKGHPKECLRINAARKCELAKDKAQIFNAEMMRLTVNDPLIIFVNPSLRLCNDGICPVFQRGQSLYTDSNHLSKVGIQYFID